MISHRKRKYINRTGAIPVEPEPIAHKSVYSAQPQNNEEIMAGDLVRHAYLDHLNAGQPLLIMSTEGHEALCSYLEKQTPVLSWYSIVDLVLVHSVTDDEYGGQ